MHLEELQTAIVDAHPELRGARFSLLQQGWDCIAVDADDALIFKFPRHEAAEKGLVMQASLLAVIRPVVTVAVPHMTIHPGPPLFSSHGKLAGDHLVATQYELLPVEARQQLASDMARFFAELHALEPALVRAAGAKPIRPWLAPDDILQRVWPVLPGDLRSYAERTITAWHSMGPDPYGMTFGFFDGHGWNMAFDHRHQRLNGIYDFGDSGLGPLHQEFIYPNWIARDLTVRIVGHYETLTGRALDHARIELLSAVLRLSELAEYAHDAEHAPAMLQNVAQWAVR